MGQDRNRKSLELQFKRKQLVIREIERVNIIFVRKLLSNNYNFLTKLAMFTKLIFLTNASMSLIN